MTTTQDSIAILDSINEVNSAIAELVGSSSSESRQVLIQWIKADMALMEELRAGMTAKIEQLRGDKNENEQCSDTVLSALDSAIAAKCLAIAALQDAEAKPRRAVRAALN